MGKNTKVMPQYPTIYLFLLGKGGNPYVSKPYIKTKNTSALSALPPAQKDSDSDKAWMMHIKIAQK